MDSTAPARRLLAVFAHPDDETFGPGGTLALYARRGVAVHLICATRGELGETPEGLRGFASVGELREHELRCAASALGLTATHLLGYRDSGMAGTPANHAPGALAAASLDAVARRIAVYIRQLHPQVVVTFDPYGGYGHPDHIATHQATVAAFELAGNPAAELDGLPPWRAAKLYYSTFPRGMLRWSVRVMRLLGRDPRAFGRNRDIDLLAIVEHATPIHARVRIREVRVQKAAAVACHASQIGGGAGLMRRIQELFDPGEAFTRAVPPGGRRLERDLFEGIPDR